MDAPSGARRATCRTARFSVTLILSPRNIASIRERKPDSSASLSRSLRVSIGDAVFRVVEKDTRGFDRHALSALGIVGEEISADALRESSYNAPAASSRPSAWSAVREPAPLRRWCHIRILLYQLAIAFLRAALLESMTAISSFQDLTKDLAPSS